MTASAEEQAATSGGRAAGYCWIKHPKQALHCTESAGHRGDHYHCYSRTAWPKTSAQTTAVAVE